jgi:transcriptional regulator with XRE-family HTH domain
MLRKMTITPGQCKAARGLIDMDQALLAKRASVSHNTIIDFETGNRAPGANNIGAIRAALESAGVEFINENGGGPGVRLRNRRSGMTIAADDLNASNDE